MSSKWERASTRSVSRAKLRFWRMSAVAFSASETLALPSLRSWIAVPTMWIGFAPAPIINVVAIVAGATSLIACQRPSAPSYCFGALAMAVATSFPVVSACTAASAFDWSLPWLNWVMPSVVTSVPKAPAAAPVRTPMRPSALLAIPNMASFGKMPSATRPRPNIAAFPSASGPASQRAVFRATGNRAS